MSVRSECWRNDSVATRASLCVRVQFTTRTFINSNIYFVLPILVCTMILYFQPFFYLPLSFICRREGKQWKQFVVKIQTLSEFSVNWNLKQATCLLFFPFYKTLFSDSKYQNDVLDLGKSNLKNKYATISLYCAMCNLILFSVNLSPEWINVFCFDDQ